MTQVVPLRSSMPVNHDARALSLIKRTVASDTNDDEFSLFIHMARALQLDPLRKQIYAFVFSKNDPKKRRMSIVTAIDGFRTIAERTGNYRPDEDEPTYEIDPALKGPLNPAGIVKASVRVWKYSHGDWHKVTAPAYWEEYAPLKDEWVDDPDTGRGKKTGKQILDTSGNWGKMPRLMLAKVAEALALRKAWPDDFSNVYAAEEMDRVRASEMTPAELAAQGAIDERQEKLGGPRIAVDWLDNKPLEPVTVGQFADRVMAFLSDNREEPMTVRLWAERNRHPLREFWAQSPGDALALKTEIEKAQTLLIDGEG